MFDPVFIDAFARQIAQHMVPHLKPLIHPEPVPAAEWMSRKQAAYYCGASKDAFREMLRDKMFPVHIIHGRERFKRSEIDAVWESGKTYLV